MSVVMLAVEQAEHADWWDTYIEIVQSPAHILGELTIETFFAVVGVHTLHRIAHHASFGMLKHLRRLMRTRR